MNELNEFSEKDGEVSGYASVFNVVDGHGDIIQKGAFKNSVKFFKSGHKKPKFLWQHEVASPIGVIEDIFEDDYGLFVRARLLQGTIKNKFARGTNNYLTDINLLEISIVTFPACELAVIENVKESNIVRNLKSISNKIKKFNQRSENL